MPLNVNIAEAAEGQGAKIKTNAKQNYGFYCAPCHGLRGLGDGINATKSQPVQPRNHTSVREMSRLSDEDIIDVIKGGGRAVGKSTMMPPFGDTLTDAEIKELLRYVRGLCKCSGR
jgi:mono/diheme cytochrome c family protein